MSVSSKQKFFNRSGLGNDARIEPLIFARMAAWFVDHRELERKLEASGFSGAGFGGGGLGGGGGFGGGGFGGGGFGGGGTINVNPGGS